MNSSTILNMNYKWISYQSNTYPGQYSGQENTTGTVRIDKSSDNYQGTPAILYKINVTESGLKPVFNQVGLSSYTDQTIYNIYYDTAMKNILGGTGSEITVTPYSTGQVTPISAISYLPSIGQIGTMMIIGGNSDSVLSDYNSLTYEGVSPVTVPSGTYSDADLYMKSGVSYWISSGIPVKIKSQTYTEELTGWG